MVQVHVVQPSMVQVDPNVTNVPFGFLHPIGFGGGSSGTKEHKLIFFNIIPYDLYKVKYSYYHEGIGAYN